ncbi:hypothetical protein B0H13DRAFT_2516327 [Mycena leptocephala]|nr:hypothetical protein B0H13DRAFT_2516327 [Mycena leptocephala]
MDRKQIVVLQPYTFDVLAFFPAWRDSKHRFHSHLHIPSVSFKLPSQDESLTVIARSDAVSFSIEFLEALHAHANTLPNLWDATARSHVEEQRSQANALAQRTPLPPSPTLSQEFEYQSLLSFNELRSFPRHLHLWLPAPRPHLSLICRVLPRRKGKGRAIDLEDDDVVIVDYRPAPKQCPTDQRSSTKRLRLSSLGSSPDFPAALLPPKDRAM